MDQFKPALDHGSLQELFPNVFFVTGAMETVLMEKEWQFSRNMVVIKSQERLVIFNSVRLNDQALAELDALGQVTDIVRVGALHGRDDEFYMDRYDATYWTLPGLESEFGFNKVQTLSPESKLPIADASVFLFEHTQVPESIIHLERNGGIVIACDALQNWLAPDQYFSEASTEMMQNMGFFKSANVGPVWMQVAAPKADDFSRVKALEFKHALCGHGEPLLEKAKESYLRTFNELFSV